MSLTPAADDPNRKQELKRADADPKAFDADPVHKHGKPANFDATSSGLCADRDKVVPEEPVPEEPVPEGEGKGEDLWAEYLENSVKDITAQLPELDNDQLVALLEAEKAGKARVTLIEAIEAETSTR